MFNFQEFLGGAQRKHISINRNGEFESPKDLHMDPDWSFMDFLNAASLRLDLVPSATRVFNANGVEINDCMMIEDDDRLFFSQEESFYATKNKREYKFQNSTEGKQESSVENSKRYHCIEDVGPYSVGDLLGKGGFGEVREGTNLLSGEIVALKFLKRSEIQSMGAVDRTANEIHCLSTLKHKNIIKLHMHLETSKHIVLAFELMKGGDLLKYLCKKGPTAAEASLTEDEGRLVFHQVVAGVSFAHNQHIIHRDLKLENLLLLDDTLNHVKIADFGLSQFYRPGGTLTSTIGTLSFQAPEVFTSSNYAGPPIDVWSLGVILFSILCGRLPFEGTDITGSRKPRDSIIKSKILKCQYKIDDTLSSDAKDLVRRMLRVDPSSRASIPEVIAHNWMRLDLYNKKNYIGSPAPSPTVPTTVPAPLSRVLNMLSLSRIIPMNSGIGKGPAVDVTVPSTDNTANCTYNSSPVGGGPRPCSKRSEVRERVNQVMDSVARSFRSDASDNLSNFFTCDGEPLFQTVDSIIVSSSSSKSNRNDQPSLFGCSSGSSMKIHWPLKELSPLGEEATVSPLGSARGSRPNSPSPMLTPIISPRLDPMPVGPVVRKSRTNDASPLDDSHYMDAEVVAISSTSVPMEDADYKFMKTKSRRGHLSTARSSSGLLRIVSSSFIGDLAELTGLSSVSAADRPLSLPQRDSGSVKEELGISSSGDTQAPLFRLVPLKRRNSLVKSSSNVKNYNSDSEESGVSAPSPVTVLDTQEGFRELAGADVLDVVAVGGSNKTKGRRLLLKKALGANSKPGAGGEGMGTGSGTGSEEGYRSAGEMKPRRSSITRSTGAAVSAIFSGCKGQSPVLRALNSDMEMGSEAPPKEMYTGSASGSSSGTVEKRVSSFNKTRLDRLRDGRRLCSEKGKARDLGHDNDTCALGDSADSKKSDRASVHMSGPTDALQELASKGEEVQAMSRGWGGPLSRQGSVRLIDTGSLSPVRTSVRGTSFRKPF